MGAKGTISQLETTAGNTFMGSSSIHTCRRFGSLANNYQEQLFHIFCREGEYVIKLAPVVTYCDTIVLHSPYGSPTRLHCNVSAISFLHMWLWAKLFVSLAQISMLSLLAELPKYHFISNERSALAMQRIHKDYDPSLVKTLKRGRRKSLALSALSWRIIIIILSFYPSCLLCLFRHRLYCAYKTPYITKSWILFRDSTIPQKNNRLYQTQNMLLNE